MTIGNWFKTNLQNSNFSKLFASFGETAFKAGMTSAAMRAMNQQQSIFGGCHSGRFYGQQNIFGGGCCNNPMNSMMYNPLGIGYNYGSDCFSEYNAQMGIQMAQQQGYADGLAIKAQLQAQNANSSSNTTNTTGSSSLPKTNWKAADAIAKDQDKTAGQKLNQATTQILKDQKGSVIIAKGIGGADGETKYKEQVSELGKSYGASMDTDGDGYVSLEEYKAAENNQADAETAFKKMDMNGDGKLDWKELAATLRTLDINSSNKRDGQISYDDLNRWQQSMQAPNSNTFDTAVRKSYQNLFNPDKKDS